MRNEGCIDYVEIAATDIDKTRAFLEQLFGWELSPQEGVRECWTTALDSKQHLEALAHS